MNFLATPSIPKLLVRLWQHVSARRRVQLSILLLVMVAASFAEVLSIGALLPFLGALTAPERLFEQRMIRPLIDLLGLTEPKDLLLPVTCIFAFAAFISGVIRLLVLWAQTRLSHAIGADFSINIYRRTLYQAYSVHVARNSSEIIAGISNKVSGVVYSVLIPVLTLFSSALILVAILATLVAIDALVAFAAFTGFATIYGIVIFATKKRLIRDSERISRESGQVIKALQEGLGGIRDVLIDGTQEAYCAIYRNADLPLRRAQANIQIIGGTPRFGIEALGMILIAMLAYSLVGRSDGMIGAIPILGALALGAQRLLPVMQYGYSSWTSVRGGQELLVDAIELLEQPLPAHAQLPLPEPLVFCQQIEITNLSFQYGKNLPMILSGVSFSIPKGSRIGFIGATGSGKSTLLDIVMGLLSPTTGSLLLDGQAIDADNCRAWQRHIAHVPQAIFLADTSIAENIAFGVPRDQIDHQRVRQSAEKAQIAKTIESWEHAYETVVGERGIRLSGGQRQRIGIARALYKQADVIVFDEATSALDNETENAVMQAIAGLSNELTIIIIAHRVSTLKNCTQIIELADGKIQRSGSFSEIIKI